MKEHKGKHRHGKAEHEHEGMMPKGKFHGSPKETHTFGKGSVGSPDPLPAAKPGKINGANGESIYGKYFEGGAESYKPKSMKRYTEE